MTITDRDRGYRALVQRLRGGERSVTVGIHAADGAEVKRGEGDEELTVAEVAAIHEFGLGVPERSWLRAFVDENEDKLRKMLVASAREVASGRLSEQVAMDRFGLAVVGMIKKRIVQGIEPPLAEKTKERKRQLTGGPKDTPLILYSQLISSILHEVQTSE